MAILSYPTSLVGYARISGICTAIFSGTRSEDLTIPEDAGLREEVGSVSVETTRQRKSYERAVEQRGRMSG
jgi:hypothetical protein